MHLVLQTAFLGDVVLTTPLLERLARTGPVDVVVTPAAAGLLVGHPAVRETIVYDKRGADRGVAGMRRLARRLAATGARTAYLAQGSLRTAAVARLAGIHDRVGFETSPGRLLYTRRVPFDRARHHAARLWRLGDPAGEASSIPPTLRPTLHPGANEQAAVDALLASHGVLPSEPIVALAPGSVWATKRWPMYDALAAALLASPALREARLVIVGAAADRPLAASIADAARGAGAAPAVDATGALSLLASAALIGRARVLVTNDSAPLHLASAMNTPTVALFGPTVPAFGFGPLAERALTLGHEGLECRPCSPHGPKECPLGHWRCMRELAVADVQDAAGRLAVAR